MGNSRFLVQRRLGAGAFGVVYEAWDARQGAPVALKVLRYAEADALYRFKKGFRSLADIRHPNLVTFYELLSEDGAWFISMELVPGIEFVHYLRGTAWDAPAAWPTPTVDGSLGSRTTAGGASRSHVPGRAPAGTELIGGGPIRLPPGRLDYDRVRGCVLQLARGLQALHHHGKVHRDIKPPNILMTQEGRLVLLDFGLVTELGSSALLESDHNALVGTPAYMAPEQAEGIPGLPASDWYSVGVILYQVLCGELPFTGNLFDVMSRKQAGPPPRIRERLPETPEDLDELCQGLLDPDPAGRFGAADVLAVLDAGPAPVLAPPKVLAESTFVGRRRFLDQLRRAFDDSRRGAVTVYVRAPSGTGKTALVQHFVEDLRRSESDVVVLEGRCYAQESVPYKAFDSLVDALSRYLMQLPQQRAEVVLPAHVAALARLFPVLRRVKAVADARRRTVEPDDLRVQRRRAFGALRELFTRLAERRSIVLVIDDLHWGDLDSFRLLEEILRPPDPPPLMLIGCYRSEDEASPFLRALAGRRDEMRERSSDVREIDLEELTAEESEELVRRLALRDEVPAERLGEVVREARGSPLFLTELVQYARDLPRLPPLAETLDDGRSAAGRRAVSPSPGRDGDSAGVRLNHLIRARIAPLADPARRLLEVVAVAGQPVAAAVARQAAGLGSQAADVVGQLLAEKLVRRVITDGGGEGQEARDELETYHERIREALVEGLSVESLRAVHHRLATALESTGTADPETLAVHFQATEMVDRARAYATSAAERAAEALAFDRAARLYNMALELQSSSGPERYALEVKLAEALANAGHSREAAETYLRAVGDSGHENPLEVQRGAAQNLLISGHIDRGLAVLGHVLRSLGMGLEMRSGRVLFSLWWQRLRLRLRGFRFRERREEDCDPAVLRRIDVCWSVEIGLCLVDVLQASEFHSRHLLLALRAGEPQRVARGVAMEVFFGAMEGGEVEDTLRQARILAGRVEGDYVAHLTEMASGMRACARGDWLAARDSLVRAEERLRESRGGMVWELDTVLHFRLLTDLHQGHWRELFDEAPDLLQLARSRGDLYLEIHLLQWVESLRHLAADRPDRAAETVGAAIARWSHQGFHYQHFGHLVAGAHIALYRGEPERAWELARDRWPELEKSMIQRIEMVLVQSCDLRARCALAVAAAAPAGRRRERLLGQAERDARRLRRADSPWADGLAALIAAGIASVRGRAAVAETFLGDAEVAFRATAMAVHAEIARYRRARLAARGPDVEDSEKALRDRCIRRPDRLAAVLAPGHWS